MTTKCSLTIFEGPDGGGKTTAAKDFAKRTGARYVHLGPMLQVKKQLARIYVDVMMPAILGHQSVVMDRSWLSEAPYAKVYRKTDPRTDSSTLRMLERLAMRCYARVVYCMPRRDCVIKNYQKRQDEEYLDNIDQLSAVYDLYMTQETALPKIYYDYTIQGAISHGDPTEAHELDVLSAGNLKAPILLVGDKFAGHKDGDHLYQWPFASFSKLGCSHWLTRQLEEAGIPESRLCWVNADQLEPSKMISTSDKTVIALGFTASETLSKSGIAHKSVNHPAHHKRFHHDKPYELIKEVLK